MDWVLVAPILTAVGIVLGAVAGILGTRQKAKTERVNYDIALHEVEQKMIQSLTSRVDDLTAQVIKCQNDKYEMQVTMHQEIEKAVERKLQEKFSGTNPDASST